MWFSPKPRFRPFFWISCKIWNFRPNIWISAARGNPHESALKSQKMREILTCAKYPDIWKTTWERQKVGKILQVEVLTCIKTNTMFCCRAFLNKKVLLKPC